MALNLGYDEGDADHVDWGVGGHRYNNDGSVIPDFFTEMAARSGRAYDDMQELPIRHDHNYEPIDDAEDEPQHIIDPELDLEDLLSLREAIDVLVRERIPRRKKRKATKPPAEPKVRFGQVVTFTKWYGGRTHYLHAAIWTSAGWYLTGKERPWRWSEIVAHMKYNETDPGKVYRSLKILENTSEGAAR